MAVALMFGVTSFAQKVVAGSLESLKNESKLNLEVDYSEAVIHGMGVKEFAEYEQDWEKDQPEIVGDIIEGIQDKIGDDYILLSDGTTTSKYSSAIPKPDLEMTNSAYDDLFNFDNCTECKEGYELIETEYKGIFTCAFTGE